MGSRTPAKRSANAVLVVDPDFRNRAKLCLAAQAAGYAAIGAASCSEATTVDRAVQFIVLDSGFAHLEVCSVVATFSKTSVILSTRGREIDDASLPFTPRARVEDPQELYHLLAAARFPEPSP